MDDINSKKISKRIKSPTNSINADSKNNTLNFVSLINKLNSEIKIFYQSIKPCIIQGKLCSNKNKTTLIQFFDLIDKNLTEFIIKAKDIFKRMKYIQKINIIEPEINNNQSLNHYKSNINNFFMESRYENKNKNEKNIINRKKKITDEEISIPSLFVDNTYSFKFKKIINKPKIKDDFSINNEYFKIEDLKNKDEKNDMIASLNSYSKHKKLINKCDDNFNPTDDKKNRSEKKILYNKLYNNICNRKCNNQKKNHHNIKRVINLRKNFIIDKKLENSNSQGFNSLNSFNNTQNNFNITTQSKKEIFDNLNRIISLLKELKLIKGDIFAKSSEAEKHKKILNKIYNELIKMITNIFKDNNTNIDSSNDYRFKNNNNYNLTYNYKIFNNNNENNNDNNIIKIDYYDNEIKNRDLIIQKLKEELNMINKRRTSKNNIYINNSDNKRKKMNNELEVIKERYSDLQKEKENILLNNEDLKNQIILLNQELEDSINKLSIYPKFKDLIIQNINFFNYHPEGNVNIEEEKIINELNLDIKSKNESIEKLNIDIKKYKKEISELNIDKKQYEEKIKQLNEEINKSKEEILKLNNEKDVLNKKYEENIIENKILKDNIEQQNQNIEKYKKIISYQEEELKNINDNEDDQKNNKELDLSLKEALNSIINSEEIKTKKRNNPKMSENQIEQDKIYLKYELLKNDYNKLNSTLQQKQKLLDNYSKISNETASKSNIDEQILELIAQHKKEIEALTQKYNRNIINLKMNLPTPFSPLTHGILIDKKYSKYDLKWYLLTILTEEQKNYENTFWVSEEDMKPILDQFGKFKTEKELEDEKFDNLYKMQEKWIKQIDENERKIEALQNKLDKYENNSDN